MVPGVHLIRTRSEWRYCGGEDIWSRLFLMTKRCTLVEALRKRENIFHHDIKT